MITKIITPLILLLVFSTGHLAANAAYDGMATVETKRSDQTTWKNQADISPTRTFTRHDPTWFAPIPKVATVGISDLVPSGCC